MIQIFIRDPPGDPQDSHWRPPRFSLETQNFCFKPPIFIETQKFSLENPKFSLEITRFSLETPNFRWRPPDYQWRPPDYQWRPQALHQDPYF